MNKIKEILFQLTFHRKYERRSNNFWATFWRIKFYDLLKVLGVVVLLAASSGLTYAVVKLDPLATLLNIPIVAVKSVLFSLAKVGIGVIAVAIAFILVTWPLRLHYNRLTKDN